MTSPSLSALQLAFAAQAAREAARPEGEAGLMSSEPIAIVGIACRFPGGADDPDKLWTLLAEGRDAVSAVPRSRWDASVVTDDPHVSGKLVTPRAALLDDIEGFDADYFGIAPREAVRMDPQQRLLLEVTWEALRDAGYRSDRLRGSSTGVFVAIYSDDYARNVYGDWEGIDAHTASGNSHGVAAGRIAYLLDLRGPAVALDTACSSSLVAVHTACRSLRAGETSMAIVGAASLLIAPEQSMSLSKWGMMAPDGRTKAFDAAADGWVRGEGGGALILKRLADALGDGDRVHAVIRGSAINQDGRSAALTAPSGLAQRAVVRAALENARVAPSRVTYVEAHGTGTSVGDPIELEALVDEIGRVAGPPCFVGTVKSNIGHLEAAAGVAGLIKVVQALRHERVPPHLHFQTLNPLVSFEGTRLHIEPDGVAWPAIGDLRVAGVSSFGFGGTNAHVVVEEAPRFPVESNADRGPWLVTLSAHNADALRAMADDVGRVSTTHHVRDLAWTLASHEALRFRASVVAGTSDDVIEPLREAAAVASATAERECDVAFVFSGHGSQWPGMGRESLRDDAVVRASLQQSDRLVHAHAGWSILETLEDDAAVARLENTECFQPVLVSLQLALADRWIADGHRPVAVLGHSVGEITAAAVAGALTRAEALQLAVDRGRLMQQLAGEGAMLAVQGDPVVIRDIAHTLPEVVVAGVNAADAVTLSGPVQAIEQCRTLFESAGIVCHRVRVNRAFHSPAMQEAASQLATQHATLSPRATTIALYSSVTGGRVDGTALDAAYWARNAREPVQFAAASRALLDVHRCALIEVSPHPVLIGPMESTRAAVGGAWPVVPTWRRNRGERATRLASTGALWCAGVAVDREALFDEPANRLSLPPYRWQRRALWAGAPLPLGRLVHSVPTVDVLPGRVTELPVLRAVAFDAVLRADDEIVATHRVADRVVVPGTLLLLAALDAAAQSATRLGVTAGTPLALTDVALESALAIGDGESRAIQITVQTDTPGELTFTIMSRALGAADGTPWDRHAAGRVRQTAATGQAAAIDEVRARCSTPVNIDGVYEALSAGGIALGAPFRLLSALQQGEGEAVATLSMADETGARSLSAQAARLDAALHALGPLAIEPDGALWMPVGYEEVYVRDVSRIASSHVALRAVAPTRDQRVADVWLYDVGGRELGSIRGLRVQRTTRLAAGGDRRPIGDLLSVTWHVTDAIEAPAFAGERWLVLEDARDGTTPIADGIEQAGGVCARVACPVAITSADAPTAEAFVRDALTTVLVGSDVGFTGVVFAWGLERAWSASSRPTEGIVEVAGSALVLLREMAARGIAPARGVVMATVGAVEVPGDVVVGSVGAAALWGLRNTASAEHPELQVRVADLPPFDRARAVQCLLAECQATDGESRVAYRADARLVARLRPRVPTAAAADQEPVALVPPSPPSLEALTATPITRHAPAPGSVEIQVEAAGLNFRDVLGVLGMVSLPTGALGGECAGVITAVGEGVQGLTIGDRVVAFALGALRTHVHAEARLVAPMPCWMSFAHASTLPVAYLTAYHALVNVARVQPGERVLVHAAAGGVGLAAVHLAHWLGAVVVGTAGSVEKRRYLQALGVAEVFDSRAATFGPALRGTDGIGTIDVVLNALSDEFIPASLDVLAPGGRFVEIGKRGIWTTEAVHERRPDIMYEAFDLTALAPPHDATLGDALRDVIGLVNRGLLPPLPTTTFPLADAVDAVRFMAQARHTGKLAIIMPTASSLPWDQGTCVVTGAFGALGRHVVDRLVRDGARSLLLLARRAPDATASGWVQDLRARGVVVRVDTVDLADGHAVQAALANARHAMAPLRGVVHTAGVNDDGTLLTQRLDQLEAVARGKVDGAWFLDQFTRLDDIAFFILFSSASGVLGWPGQSTYSAANTALDQVARVRRASGRSAISIQWGTWSGGGMAERVRDGAQRFSASGMHAFSVEEALDLMATLAVAPDAQALAMRADWNAFADARPGDRRFFEQVRRREVVTSRLAEANAAPQRTLLAGLAELPESLRLDTAREAMMRLAARALGLPSSARVDASRPLRDLGLDSLMAVELRNAIGTAVGRTLPATLLFEHPSVDALATYVIALLPLDPTGTAVAPEHARAAASHTVAPSSPPIARDAVASLSDDDAEALLLAELAAARSHDPRSRR